MVHPSSPHRIAIIGGGFSGAVLARALIAETRDRLSLVVVEPRAALGGGVAYSTSEPGHLVNGPALPFSIHANDPDHFIRWLDAYVRDAGPVADRWRDGDDIFAPRHVYASYVGSELGRSIEDAGERLTFAHVRSGATRLAFDRTSASIAIEDGRTIEADHVVLATGVPRIRPNFEDERLLKSPAYVRDPWRLEAYAPFADGRHVAIVGSGLTMLDALVSLDRVGFHGSVQVISRRGLSVWARRSVQPWPNVLDPDALPHSARGLLHIIQRARRDIAKAGADWQSLPLAIVPHAATIWKKADVRERRIYLRHLRAFWEVTRHRAAPPTHRLADAWRAQGRLQVRAGRIDRALTPAPHGLEMTLRWRGETKIRNVPFDGVINGMGSEYDIRGAAEANPLLNDLLRNGLIRPGPLSFGIDASEDGVVIGRSGAANPRLSAIGPLLRGVHWESNAIPEILPQVASLATRLARQIDGAREVA